jgi:hypothetical protein
MAGSVLTPKDLHALSDEQELARVREALEKKRKMENEEKQIHDEFMQRELRADVHERLNAALHRAAEMGLRELKVMEFPASYCADHGRAINALDPDWPQSLTGFAERGYQFYKKELEPKGFKLRAQVVSFREGLPGDVAIYLGW